MNTKPVSQPGINIGKRLRIARASRGVSQTDLANVLGLTNTSIHAYEKGRNHVSLDNLKRIAEYLDYPIQWFYEGTSESDHLRPHEKRIYNFNTSEAQKVLKAYFKITSIKRRKSILKLIIDLGSEP